MSLENLSLEDLHNRLLQWEGNLENASCEEMAETCEQEIARITDEINNRATQAMGW